MGYKDKIYNKYLTCGFDGLNSAGFELIAKAYRLNYHGILPIGKLASIVDIGCGMGHFLHFLKDENYVNASGVDIGGQQVEYCSNNGLKNVKKIENVFNFLKDNPEQFDAVVINDVLEHFNKEEAFLLLESIRGALKPAGRIILKTPNMSNLFASSSVHIDFTHEIGFSEISIVQALSASGFRNAKCLQERIYISNPMKRWLFSLIHGIYTLLLKAVIYIDRPGDNYPKILSKNIIAYADK